MGPGDDLTGIKPDKEIPYSREGAYQLFMDVKRGNEQKVREALQEDRFLGNMHNEMHQTPLIVAAKRNKLAMGRILLDYKVYFGSLD